MSQDNAQPQNSASSQSTTTNQPALAPTIAASQPVEANTSSIADMPPKPIPPKDGPGYTVVSEMDKRRKNE